MRHNGCRKRYGNSKTSRSSADNTVQDQLHLMEKSYQLAAKYMPATPPQEQTITKQEAPVQPVSVGEKEYFVAFTPVSKNTVSALYRPITDSAFITNLVHQDQQEFFTAGLPNSRHS